jgi:DNA-binding NarL/FixJ family response regulator
MRVLIADDHGIVRSGLRLLLEREPDIEVVGEASDGVEARDLAIKERPDLAILDVRMPRLTGLQATREIREQVPDAADRPTWTCSTQCAPCSAASRS